MLAVETGMLAVLSSRFPGLQAVTTVGWVLLLLSVALIGVILFFLYKIAYPDVKGGEQSLIYFREIAGRTEANFIQQFTSQSENDRLRDAVGQVWRNSAILRKEFDALRLPFTLMAIAVAP